MIPLLHFTAQLVFIYIYRREYFYECIDTPFDSQEFIDNYNPFIFQYTIAGIEVTLLITNDIASFLVQLFQFFKRVWRIFEAHLQVQVSMAKIRKFAALLMISLVGTGFVNRTVAQ